MVRGCKSSEVHVRKNLNYLEVTTVRNMDNKGESHEASDKNEEHVIRKRKKSDPCYKMAKNLILVFCGKKLKVINLEIQLRRFF